MSWHYHYYVKTSVALLVAIFLLPIQPAYAQISLKSIGLYPEAKVGSEYFVELEFKSLSNLTIKSYLINMQNEKLVGSARLAKGSLKDGKWVISWQIGNNVRTGNYKLFIEAQSGKFTWRSQDKTVKITVNQSNEAAPISPANENIQYGLKSTCGIGLKKCPEALSPTQYLPISTCKIKDATFPQDNSDGYVGSGFPPPPYSLAGQGEINLLWIPVNFSDNKVPNLLYEQAKNTARQTEDFYRFNSYGRVKLNVIVPSQKNSINLPNTVKYYENLWAANTTNVTQFLLDQFTLSAGAKIDAVMWLFPQGKYRIVQEFSSGRTTFYSLGSNSIPAARIYGLHTELESIGVNGFDHGVGHALYSFEDLYIFGGYSASGKNDQPGNGWDVMIGGGEFFGWSRWIAGWMKDSEVVCLESKLEPQTIYIKTLQDPDGPKLITIPVSDSKVILAEYRTNTLKSVIKKYQICDKKTGNQCKYRYRYSGLLLYNLDTTRSHGNAPYRVAKTDAEKLLEVGDSVVYEGFQFAVKGADAEGIYVKVSKSK